MDKIIQLLEQTVPVFLYKNIKDISQNYLEMPSEHAEPLLIANVIMKFWSLKMFRYAENLILDKAIEDGYFKREQKKFIKIFNQEEEEEEENTKYNWVITNKDNIIINLIWEKFNMKNHFEQVSSHRNWVLRSYLALKDVLPHNNDNNLLEIINRHDLSKFAFRQAIGYTLKWVHNINRDPIWEAARILHIWNEPHHPQMWHLNQTQTRKRIKTWLNNNNNNNNNNNLNLDNEKHIFFPLIFLLESYIDMVAIEWKKSGRGDDILKKDLINIVDEKFMNRYTITDRNTLNNVIKSVM